MGGPVPAPRAWSRTGPSEVSALGAACNMPPIYGFPIPYHGTFGVYETYNWRYNGTLTFGPHSHFMLVDGSPTVFWATF